MKEEKETIYLVELSQTQIEEIISALDTVVKTHGLSVAEKCGALHRALIEKSNPIEEVKSEAVEEAPLEEVSLEEVEDELQQIMQVPKKRKRTTKRKK